MCSTTFFFFQAEDGIRDKLVTGVRRVLFRSRGQRLERPRVLRAVSWTHRPGPDRRTTRGREAAYPVDHHGDLTSQTKPSLIVRHVMASSWGFPCLGSREQPARWHGLSPFTFRYCPAGH